MNLLGKSFGGGEVPTTNSNFNVCDILVTIFNSKSDIRHFYDIDRNWLNFLLFIANFLSFFLGKVVLS